MTVFVNTLQRILVSSILIVACALLLPATTFADSSLPTLGEDSAGLLTRDQEYRLGRNWLRQLRRQAPTLPDPLVKDYITYLTYRLAAHSELQDHRLELLLIDSPSLNAFAAPGGIVGINGGLFLFAQREQEFASVIAHELAHLSQRHFARNMERMQQGQVAGLAAILASIALMSTTEGDAGVAAMASTQAAAYQAQLAFSRSDEREADRIGIQTLVNAGMNPNAMPSMFERLHQASGLASGQAYEFLQTHPVTESRIADSRNRAAQYHSGDAKDSLEYKLMQARIRLHYEGKNPNQAVKLFKAELESATDLMVREANRYGLALAQLKANQADQAHTTLSPLLKKYPNRISIVVAQAEIEQAQGRYDAAQQRLNTHLQLNPGNYPLTLTFARLLLEQGQYDKSRTLLAELSETHPTDPQVWYWLAEAEGLAGNRIGVHQARAEYFQLNGRMGDALEQLELARMRSVNYQQQARIRQRTKEIVALDKQMRAATQ